MNNFKRKKKKKSGFNKALVYIIIIVIITIYINTNIIFKPFLSYQGDQNLEIIIKEWLDQNYPFPFLTKNKIEKIHPDKINKSLSIIKLERNYFLVWTIKLQKKVSTRYILLNGEIRALDENFYILDASLNQEEIKKQIPFLLQIEVLENLPIKTNENKIKSTDKAPFIEKSDSLATKLDILKIYQKEILPFVGYLFSSESSLGPKISLIQFFPKEGLRFIVFNNIYWIGFNKKFSQIESNLAVCENYLKMKNKKQSYNEFDLRFKNQIICRNNQ